jgi:hypothetical protein
MKQPPPTVPAWRKHALPVAALWAFALLAYSNSFSTGFPFDNGTIILRDPRVHAATSENINLIWTQEYWYGSRTTGLYRPLTALSYLFNYAVLGNGEHAGGYHVVNFALHATNVLLVYLLGLIVFADVAQASWPALGRPGGLPHMFPAVAMAALWGVHPILTESVTNIVGRADLLAAFGVLAGLLCYIQSNRSGKPIWLAAAALAVLIGQFSKESAIVVIAIVVLYDLAFATIRPLRFAAILVPILAYLFVRFGMLSTLDMGVVPFADNPLTGAGFFTAEMTAIKVIGKYLWLLVWPARLSNDYSYNQVPLFAWRAGDFAAVLTCLAALAAGAWAWRRNRKLFFFIGFFFIAVAPTSNLLVRTGTIMAERFLYLPAIAFAGVIVVLVGQASRPVQGAIVAVLCLAFAARTFARNFDWKDDESIWASAARTAPDSFKPHVTLAELNHSVEEADRAIAILDPLPDELNTARPYAVAGTCHRLKGDKAKALALLQRGQRIDLAALETIRRDYAARGRIVHPSGWPPLYLELGRTYEALNDPQHAVEALEYGAVLRPDPEFFSEMSRVAGRPAVALTEGMSLNPDAPQLGVELVKLYQTSAPQSCAISNGNLNVQCPLVRGDICDGLRAAAGLQERRGYRVEAAALRASSVRDLGCPQ